MKDGTLVNGSTGNTSSLLAKSCLTESGIVVDFMTGDQARKSQVYVPPKSVDASILAPEIAWPVVEFVRSKYATGPYYSRTLIAQMSVDVTNARDKMEAQRHQVPLILAWLVRCEGHAAPC